MRTLKLLAASLLIAALSLFSCSEKIEPGNTPPTEGPSVAVRMIEARSAVQPVVYEAVGTVKAQVSATVSSKLMGVIQAYKVKEGDLVKQGDLLVVLDERQVSAQLSQARAALSEAGKAEGYVARRAAEIFPQTLNHEADVEDVDLVRQDVI